jgi:hypothetical protein
LRISILKTNGFYSNIIGISTMKYPWNIHVTMKYPYVDLVDLSPRVGLAVGPSSEVRWSTSNHLEGSRLGGRYSTGQV